MVRPLEKENHPFASFIHENPLDRFMTLDFSYLVENRLVFRKSKYVSDTENQIPEIGLFPIERELIKNLIDICEEKKMSPADIVRLFPALHICLYAHQTQFRESGQPYTIHPFEMAIGAVRDHNADWQTAALCLLHDVKEDSKKNGFEVKTWVVDHIYTQLFKGDRGEHFQQAKRDAQFLVRGMEALHKVSYKKDSDKKESKATDLPKKKDRDQAKEGNADGSNSIVLLEKEGKEKDATLETVKKLYATFLKDVKKSMTDVRFVLVKLLDRKHNLSTIEFMPEEKQRLKAQETFLYITMAEAFHMYTLRDTLTKLVLEVLDPAQAVYIDSMVDAHQNLKRVYEETGAIKLLNEALEDQNIITVDLKLPGFYEIYNATVQDVFDETPFLNLDIILDDNESENFSAWLKRAENTANIAARTLGRANIDNLNINIDPDGKRRIEARISISLKNGGQINLNLHLSGKRQFIRDHASITDLYPRSVYPLGTKAEWQKALQTNLQDLHDRFEKAKRLRDFSLFAETGVAGVKSVFDKKGNRFYLSREATWFEALWMIYGDDVYRSFNAHVRIGKTVQIIGELDFDKTAPEGVVIVGMEVLKLLPGEPPKTASLMDLRKCHSLGIRQAIMRQIEQSLDQGDRRADIISSGKYIIDLDYERAWKESVRNHGVLEGEINCPIPVPISKVRNGYLQAYKDDEELLLALGRGIIPQSVYKRLIQEMVRYRGDIIYMQFQLTDIDELRLLLSIIDKFGIKPEKFLGRQSKMLEAGNISYRVWFHESQLGDQVERETKFDELIDNITESGINPSFYFDWKKRPILYPTIETDDSNESFAETI